MNYAIEQILNRMINETNIELMMMEEILNDADNKADGDFIINYLEKVDLKNKLGNIQKEIGYKVGFFNIPTPDVISSIQALEQILLSDNTNQSNDTKVVRQASQDKIIIRNYLNHYENVLKKCRANNGTEKFVDSINQRLAPEIHIKRKKK